MNHYHRMILLPPQKLTLLLNSEDGIPQKKHKIDEGNYKIFLYTYDELKKDFIFAQDFCFDVPIKDIIEPSILTNEYNCNMNNVKEKLYFIEK